MGKLEGFVYRAAHAEASFTDHVCIDFGGAGQSGSWLAFGYLRASPEGRYTEPYPLAKSLEC